MEITEAACVCEEFNMPFKDKIIVSLGDSRIKHVRDRTAILSMQTDRVVVLEYS